MNEADLRCARCKKELTAENIIGWSGTQYYDGKGKLITVYWCPDHE